MKKYLMRTSIAPMRFGSRILLALMLLPMQCLWSQTFDYGNGWYDAGQDYIRLKVARDGIYRVTPQQLVSAGLDTAGLDLSHLHLWWRGQEQAIHIDTVGGQWNFLEFFGRRNDAGLDTFMYVSSYSGQPNGGLHPNPLNSNFGDTTVYYLHADNLPGLRMQPAPLVSVPLPPIVRSYNKTSYRNYAPGDGGEWSLGAGPSMDPFTMINPEWTVGEGYLGADLVSGVPYVEQLPTTHATGVLVATLHLRILGLEPYDRDLSIYADGQLLAQYTRQGYFAEDFSLVLPQPLDDTLDLRIESVSTSGSGWCNVTYAAVTYTADADLEGSQTVTFPRYNVTDAYHMFQHVGLGNIAVGYDLHNQVRVVDTVRGDSLGIWVSGASQPGLMYIATDAAIASPVVSGGAGSTLGAVTNGADMVLITSRALASSAAAYQAFRQSSAHPLAVRVVFLDEIYEEFGYGSPHPWAIKRFCKYAIDEWSLPPTYFLMWGEGSREMRGGPPQQVPTYGYPGSDHLFVGHFDRDTMDYTPKAAIGRLPILENAQGLAYIAKLAHYESLPQQSWMRNAMFVCAADDSSTMATIVPLSDHFADIYQGTPLYGRALRYDVFDSVETSGNPLTMRQALDSGVGVLNMLTPSISSTTIGIPGDYADTDRYPFLIGQGCFMSKMGDTVTDWTEQWVLAAGMGGIGAIAHTSGPFVVATGRWGDAFMDLAFRPGQSQTLGQCMRAAIDTIALQQPASWIDIHHSLSMAFIGDPSLVLRTGEFEVWPGDASDDLVADNHDLLYVGLAYGEIGTPRPSATLNWVGQLATPWDTAFVSGSDFSHADCNGDGAVTADDTLAIHQNYGMVHSKALLPMGGAASDPPLSVESATTVLPSGAQVDLYVRLGTPSQPADSVHGIAWSVLYDPQLVDSASITVDFDSCWLGQQGVDLLTMARVLHTHGRVDLAITRTDHVPVSGEGVIAHVGIVVIDNISGKLPGDTVRMPLPLAPAAGRMLDPAGNDLPLRGEGLELTILSEVPAPTLAHDRALAVFPNPSSDEIYIQTQADGPCEVTLYDLSGRRLTQRSFGLGVHKRVRLGHLPAGVYLLQVETPLGSHRERVLKRD